MGLLAVYERFLKAPSPHSLADIATLQYVTTLTSFTKPTPIVVHLEDQHKKDVKKKSEKIISAVEGLTSVAVVVDTTLEFVNSGGAYLPGLDTFILDKVAILPVVSTLPSLYQEICSFLHRHTSFTLMQMTRSRRYDLVGTRVTSSSRWML